MFTPNKDNYIQLLGVGFPLHDLRKTGVYAVLDPLDAPTSGAYFVTVYNHRISVRETVQVIHHADIGSSWSRYWDASGWSAWLPLAQVAGSGNLSIGDVTADAVEVRIDTGTDAVILAATETDAGVMSAADKTKLNAIEPGAEANPSASEISDWLDALFGGTEWRTGSNLSMSRTATTVTVESDPGTDAELLAASEFLAGVMTAADKTKLNAIEPGATADMSPAEIVSAVNAALGSTAWQNNDPGSATTNPSVRVATTTSITIASDLNDGDTLDGVTLVDGDIVLVKDQSSPEENGIYVVGVTPARHPNFTTYDSYPGIIVTVQEGTANDDTVWLCTSNTGGTVDTDPLTFLQTEITPTNLTTTRDATTVTVNSSTGSGAVLASSTETDAGVMSAADKTKLNALNTSGNTSVTVTHNADDVDLGVSGDGDGDTINAATTSTAGVMSADDKTKLDGIEEGAQVNPTAADLVTAINTELGGTGWQIDPTTPVQAKAFLARRTSSQAISTAPTTVTFPTEIYDADNVFTPGSGAYQPGVNGIVLLAVSITGNRANVSSSWGDIQIVKNGSTVLGQVRDTNTVVNNVSLSLVDICTPSDVYTVRSAGASGDGGEIIQAVFSGCMINTGTAEIEATTNLTFSRDDTTVTVESDSGTDAELPAATDSLAGVMAAADKAKLDGLENYTHPNHTGDVTSVGDGATTITNNAVSNAKLADVASGTIKGRVSASTGDPEDLTPEQIRTLLNVENGAEVNPSDADIVAAINAELGGTGWQTGAVTNLSFTRDATTVTVTSDTGTDAELPAATTTDAGVMSASDKTKLDGIEAGAQVNPDGAAIVSAINSELGGTDWQSGGGGGGSSDAIDITYDNETSELEAENVQEAIDEIVAELNGISGSTNLSFDRDATTVTVLSDTGSDAILPTATTSLAGVLTAADKTKLDGIAEGAQVNPSASEIVSSIDSQLGSSNWRAVKKALVDTVAFSNINLASGITGGVSGIGVSSSDWVLLVGQTDPTENGIYQADVVPAVRHPNFTTWNSFVHTDIEVTRGLEAGQIFRSTSGVYGTIGTNALNFAYYGPPNVILKVATTGDISIASGLNSGDTIDGITLANGDLVLVKDQTDPADNGVYVVGSVGLRVFQWKAYDNLVGRIFAISNGSTNGGTSWICTSTKGGTLGSTALNFAKLITGSGANSAAGISYDNGDSGLAASNVQDALDEIVEELNAVATSVTAAEDVTYDNTASGMGASDVQAALDELATELHSWVPTASSGFVGFAAHRNGTNQGSITAGSYTKINFTHEHYDVGGYFNTSNGRFTPPAGRYRLGLRIYWISSINDAAQNSAVIYKNGSVAAGGKYFTAFSGTTNQASIIELDVEANGTDYFEPYGWCGGTGTKTASGDPEMTIFYAHKIDTVSPTNLSTDRDATTVTVESDTGTDAVLPAATTSLAGVMSAADKAALGGRRSVNAQTGTSYTLQVSDEGALCTFDNSSAISVEIPNNTDEAIPVAAQIDVAQIGDGQVTFVPGSGVTLISIDDKLKLAGKGAGAMIVKLATNTFLLMGGLVD